MPSPNLSHRPSRAPAEFSSPSSAFNLGRSGSSQGSSSSEQLNWSLAGSSARARRPYNDISTPPRTSSNDSPRTLTLSDRALQQDLLQSGVQTNSQSHQPELLVQQDRSRARFSQSSFESASHSSGPLEDWSQPAPLWTSDPSAYQIRDVDMEQVLEADAQAAAATALSNSGPARRRAQNDREEAYRRELEYLAFQRTSSLAAEQSYVLQQQFHHQQQQQQQAALQQQHRQQASSTTNAAASSSSSSKSSEPRHRVYLLNCKYCGTFLSNRGQKAVLLLEPHITLYSTDSIPFNCGPLYIPPPVERTCDCITHSLGCYGCGAQVGYHIVAPCSRCTSSVANHRSSNGHRTVLHRSEISVRERRFVPGEPGIMATPYIPQPTAAFSGSTTAMGLGVTTSAVDSPSNRSGAASPAPPIALVASGPSIHRLASRTMRSASTAGWSSPSGESSTSRGPSPNRGPTDFYAGTYRRAVAAASPAAQADADKGGDVPMQSQQYRDHAGESRPVLHQSRVTPVNPPAIRISDSSNNNNNNVSPSWAYHGGAQSPATNTHNSSNNKTGAAGGSGGNVPRVIKRGDVLYWSDLAPETTGAYSERQVPLDPDMVLNQPLAGR